MTRLLEAIRFREALPEERRAEVMMDYVRSHPEQELLAFVYAEATRWLQRLVPEESDNYVMLAALNFVDCIAHVSLPDAAASRRGGNRKLC